MCPDNYKRKTKSCLCLSYVQDREMYRSARNPARQLNSKPIKDAASCFSSPIIRSRLSVVTATCVWRVQRKDLTEAWKLVCKKREECNRSLLTLEGLEFFFSVIGVKEPPKQIKRRAILKSVTTMKMVMKMKTAESQKARKYLRQLREALQ